MVTVTHNKRRVETVIRSFMDECDWEAAKADEKGALSLQCTSLLNQASAQIQNINLYNIYGGM